MVEILVNKMIENKKAAANSALALGSYTHSEENIYYI